MSETGTAAMDRASAFYDLVIVKLRRSHNRPVVFERFLGILDEEAAQDLIAQIMKYYGKETNDIARLL